ncbi:hypothetical protein QBC33DRAFT_591748 [Phialemonium atrogriseum]|uniref:Extracellular membrane protein CFEM domain-containing protein n=1 Tax=Phialemonium atrogriseum TaxID=1093897 RepID=A0AAJ0CBY8_9PEZI|nr:uncharacterized protein QBC33DRAFT_591748 [Phialemonium atrogriseum]KAK1771456.1 hypothetical protein QBC33DRAFT_591748 [Phialemonium atrogriseum]
MPPAPPNSPPLPFAPLLLLFLLGLSLLAQPATAAPHTDNSTASAGVEPRDGDGRRTPGSDCAGSEGLWDCMTDSWQRCASGRWSEVMQCAAGTECAPAGQSYEFEVRYAGGGGGGGVSGGSSGVVGRGSGMGSAAGWGVGLAFGVGVLLAGWGL